MKTKGKACYSSSNKWNKIVNLNISYKLFAIVASNAAIIYENIAMLDLQRMMWLDIGLVKKAMTEK